jgi:cytochrome d ubiquinol oxidase subunit I
MTDAETALSAGANSFAVHRQLPFHLSAFSIGLASYLAVLEALWLKTGRGVYLNLFKYWLKIFAIAFAMGVVSASSCPTSSAPTGRSFPTRPGR